ncbi:hypothetical protein [Streptomyces erythrochromogenes]|uniref:hypothetical protein n=1 Tax=Streptomyces erythrochromogenes TaxID=285574 RepID=UPI0036FA424D
MSALLDQIDMPVLLAALPADERDAASLMGLTAARRVGGGLAPVARRLRTGRRRAMGRSARSPASCGATGIGGYCGIRTVSTM